MAMFDFLKSRGQQLQEEKVRLGAEMKLIDLSKEVEEMRQQRDQKRQELEDLKDRARVSQRASSTQDGTSRAPSETSGPRTGSPATRRRTTSSTPGSSKDAST